MAAAPSPPPAPIKITVAWVILDGFPWWPALVCDPVSLARSTRYLDMTVQSLLETVRRAPCDYHILFYFGKRTFGIHPSRTHHSKLRPWKCLGHKNLVAGYPKDRLRNSDTRRALAQAIREAEAFLEGILLFDFTTEPSVAAAATFPVATSALVDLTEDAAADAVDLTQDDDDDMFADMAAVPLDCVAWAKLQDSDPWWPVYVCDPVSVRPALYHLGTSHADVVALAKTRADTARLVFAFGRYTFILLDTRIRPWRTPSMDEVSMPEDDTIADALAQAMHEAAAFLTADPTIRCLPFLIPSDMNMPSPVPPPARPSVTADSIVWVWHKRNSAWRPAYVISVPSSLSPASTKTKAKSRHYDDDDRIGPAKTDRRAVLFVFGSRDHLRFAWPLVASTIQPWHGKAHALFARGYPTYPTDDAVLALAMHDVEAYLQLDPATRTPPHVVPRKRSADAAVGPTPPGHDDGHDDEPTTSRAPRAIHAVALSSSTHDATMKVTWTDDQVAWLKLGNDHPWPVWVCGPPLAKETLVYHFGTHEFGSYAQDMLDPNRPPDSATQAMLSASPKDADWCAAVDEVEDFVRVFGPPPTTTMDDAHAAPKSAAETRQGSPLKRSKVTDREDPIVHAAMSIPVSL
ncbi:Aste57867_15885 [Aphanomyces stellatus]|uniref:Aste57867_15885 protein n=1 Tax=Aphanomyces stellatus TaxID=120398 RepID=A0A485L459_9STRA|nr:hypothetical protein As57867_015829 [Aphanomyces stellatus]VFT92672.1 Aste57867_15885 [Aphanomyces stellatus]